MEEDIKNLLEIVVKRYIEEYIINLDLSDSTKNILKRQLRKTILDEDLLYDLETTVYKNSIPTSLVEEKIEELKEDEEFYREHDRMNEFESKIKLLQELLED